MMTTPRRSARSVTLPYAFGWFSQVYLGEQIWWHFGQEESYASLLLWLPRRHLTLAVLANSAAMSDAARLLEGNVAHSLLAQAFFRAVLHLTPNPALERDNQIATALADLYIGARTKADSLTRTAFAQSPELAHEPDLGTLFLLVILHDHTLDAAARGVSDTLVTARPTLPPALYYGSVVALQAADTGRATELLEQLARMPDPPHHYSVVLGLRDLGLLQESRRPAEARTLLQRVIDMNWNVDDAVDTAKRALAALRR